MLKIGVYGSAVDPDPAITAKIKRLGEVLAQKDIIVVTGAAPGVPYAVAKSAHEKGAEIWGFPPWYNGNHPLEGDDEFDPTHDFSIYSKMIYVPEHAKEYVCNPQEAKMYRDFRSTQFVDGAIIVAGRWGTLNEFTNLIEMDKVIGVLLGSGGIADLLPYLSDKIKKHANAEIIFKDNPEVLVDAVLNLLKA